MKITKQQTYTVSQYDVVLGETLFSCGTGQWTTDIARAQPMTKQEANAIADENPTRYSVVVLPTKDKP